LIEFILFLFGKALSTKQAQQMLPLLRRCAGRKVSVLNLCSGPLTESAQKSFAPFYTVVHFELNLVLLGTNVGGSKRQNLETEEGLR
jgi:hypothetical protein